MRFGSNAEHLRWKFRALTKQPEEYYSQLGANLIKYLGKCLQQEGAETVQDLKNIMGLEQLRDVVALWAKPQKPVLQGQKTKQS